MAWEQARDMYVGPWRLQEKPLYIQYHAAKYSRIILQKENESSCCYKLC